MQSVKSDLQSIFHQYDDIQELFFQGDVSSFDINARDSHGKTLLHHACEYGLTEGVSILLENIAQVNVCDEKGYTPLHYVCQNSHIHYDICKILIQRDPSATVPLTQGVRGSRSTVTAQDKFSRTILHYACIFGDFDVADSLLKAGADPCVQDIHGNNPVHYACRYGHLKCIHYFIKNSQNSMDFLQVSNNAGCTPFSVKTRNGGTILHVACAQGHIATVKMLLKAGAAPNVKDDFVFTPHMRAVVNSLDARDVHGRTPLHLACDKGDINLVKKLLDDGADPNVRDEFGFTPLIRAVVSTSTSHITTDVVHSIITALCSSKCNLNAEFVSSRPSDLNVHYCEGSTALHMTIDGLADNQLCVQALIENGAALDARDVNGRIPLHIASMRGHHHLIKLLASSPKSFHFKDNDGCTPLHYACKNSQLQCVRKFIFHIPNVICDLMKVANKYGATPLSVRGDNDQTILHVACKKGDLSIVKVLEAGADPKVTDRLGCTPLYYACKNSHLECVREFMVQIPDVFCNFMKLANKYGATPLSALGDNDRTILHVACDKGDLPIVKKLLEAGADSNSRDKGNFRPLMLAVQHVDDVKAAEIVTILCEFKCNINIQTSPLSRSLTALHLACELGKEKCVEILVAKGANLLLRAEGGSTPLHLACKGGYHTLISSLITEETLKAYDYFKYWTPLHYACGYHHIECVRRIVVGFSKVLLEIHTPYYNNRYLTFHSLRDEDGRTILHYAFMENDVQFVENLLNLGADPYVQDNNGATPLMSALHCHGNDTDMNLLSLLLSLDWKPDTKDNSGRTALHYSAKCDDIRIPLMLISAGCDVTAVDNHGQTFSDLISKESLGLINKRLLRIDRRQIICVVGYPKCGKTTIIAAFQQAQQKCSALQRLIARFQSTKVTVPNCRTSGIDTKVITTKRLGSLIFFDFAGQSEYYSSHLAFLESALSAKGSTITFIMMVDLRCSEEDRIAQCNEWLFPIKSNLKDHNMLNVILIGSHLDQVGSVSTSISSLQDTLRELKKTLGTPQMQFIDCWGMDCRQLSSKGMTNLQNCLQSTCPAHITSAEASQVPLGACLLFDRIKNCENPPLAITPSKIIDQLKNGHPPFPLTMKHIDSCCQDLAASGLVLYIPNREDAGESWLILEMEEILGRIHGKLFAPNSAEFPMHHKNLANQFGLVHMEELTLAFNGSPLDPEMVQKLLTAMEFCHPIDSSLMTEGILDGFYSKVSHDLRDNLLFFPSFVKAKKELVVLSTESDIPGDDCHWVCWELSTVKPHFLHPRFQQAVFIRLACKYVQKHKADLGTVEKHSCTVSKNAMSWSTIHGVDVCVQIMHKSTIKVLARSRPGVKVSSLMEMLSSVVSDVLTVRAHHAPGVDAYSVFRVMKKETPEEHTVPVTSIIDVVQTGTVTGKMYVNSIEDPPRLVLLEHLFLDWEISVTLLKKMVSISNITHGPDDVDDNVQGTEDVDVDVNVNEDEATAEEFFNEPLRIEEHYYEDQKLILSDLYSALTTEYVVASRWKLFAKCLKVKWHFIKVIEEECLDSSSRFHEEGIVKECLRHILQEWLCEEEGTGDLPRNWDTILSTLERCRITTLADSLRKQIRFTGSSTPQDTGTSKQESPSGDEEQNTTVHGPNPGPGKHGSKDDVTWKDKSSLPYSEHDVPDSLTQDNGEVESSHEQAVFDSDMSPSDVGLQGILEMLPVWEEYVISLGLTIRQVEYYQGLPQRTMRGLLALEYWRDGQCGPSYPCTWRFLLDVIKDRLGPNVAEDLRKKVAVDKSWTISSPTGNPPTSQADVHDDTDTLPTLLDDDGNKDSTKSIKYLIRVQDDASELEEPHGDEELGSKLQLSQMILLIKPNEAELVRLVGSQMCAKWNTFAVYLGIEKHIRDEVSYKCLREPKDCFIEVVGRWLSHEDGTGVNPRTWETVFSALQEMGFTLLVKEVTQKLSKRLETSQQ